jgi:hypothetical protein
MISDQLSKKRPAFDFGLGRPTPQPHATPRLMAIVMGIVVMAVMCNLGDMMVILPLHLDL